MEEIMKKILLAVCLMFGGATFVSAQEDQRPTQGQTQTQSTQDQDQDQDKQQIAISELPNSVTAKLESEDFSGWTVGNAYKKMDESNQEMYIVELRQGTDTKKIKFDKDGNEIEKGKHEEHSDNANYRDDSESEVADPSMKSEESEESAEELESENEGLESSETETPAETPESETQSSEIQSTEESTEHADESSTEQEPQR